MRRVVGLALAGGLVLGPASRAGAQDALNAFGGVPAGIAIAPGTALPGSALSAEANAYVVTPGATYPIAVYYGAYPDTYTFPLYAYPGTRYYEPTHGYTPTYLWPFNGVVRGRRWRW